jgi:hypothetical protein
VTDDAPVGSILWYLRRGEPLPPEMVEMLEATADRIEAILGPVEPLPAIDLAELISPQPQANGLTGASMAPRPRLPLDANRYTLASLQKAVRRFAEQATVRDVARETVFTKQDASRVRRLWQRGYLTLNGKGVLMIDDRVARDRRRYVLRVWDEPATAWRDPSRLR